MAQIHDTAATTSRTACVEESFKSTSDHLEAEMQEARLGRPRVVATLIVVPLLFSSAAIAGDTFLRHTSFENSTFSNHPRAKMSITASPGAFNNIISVTRKADGTFEFFELGAFSGSHTLIHKQDATTVPAVLGGCWVDPLNARHVTCPAKPTITRVYATLGDGNDQFLANVEQVGRWAIVYGNAGNDLIFGFDTPDGYADGPHDALYGGAGNDTLDGKKGEDVLRGGPGDDVLVGASQEGSEPNPDVLDGGDGVDTVSYAGTAQRVTMTLDGQANDGRFSNNDPGDAEGDNVISIEWVIGGSVGDLLTGNDAANRFEGNAGNDELRGLGGADKLYGGSGNDFVLGGLGDDYLEGGGGNDELVGGGGRDSINAGSGDDTIRVTGDATLDTVICGIGNDTVYAGTEDTVTVDCENVIRSSR